MVSKLMEMGGELGYPHRRGKEAQYLDPLLYQMLKRENMLLGQR